MEFVFKNFGKYGVYMASGVVVLGATCIYLWRTRQGKTERVCGVDYPKDVVILHQLGRERTIPSHGHFVIKLETFLRFNKIPYQSEFTSGTFNTGPKKKIPWIEYNGITMGDSQLIIEYLENAMNINMDCHLTTQEKAHAWAIQKWLEEFMYWLNVQTTWYIFIDELFAERLTSFPVCQKRSIKEWVGNMTYTVGVGRHSNEEVQEMVVDNLRKFSTLLGDKQFIMGDDMAVVDRAAFGILSEMRWATPSSCRGRQLFESGEISNVINYLDRIKALCWPDWDTLKTE